MLGFLLLGQGFRSRTLLAQLVKDRGNSVPTFLLGSSAEFVGNYGQKTGSEQLTAFRAYRQGNLKAIWKLTKWENHWCIVLHLNWDAEATKTIAAYLSRTVFFRCYSCLSC